MQECAEPVRVVDGQVMTEAGIGPVARVWLPMNGQVIAKIPAREGNTLWLRRSVEIRSPRLDGDRWFLPRNCMVRLLTAAVDRYGYVVVWRDMARLSRCSKTCLEASGAECDCACLGANHGQDSGGWFQRVGNVVVSDRGEITRSVIIYGPRGALGNAVIYHGELYDRRYRAGRAGRGDWPPASQFMCTGCVSTRACVWDHCHTHGYVRAPLCNTCNSRRWHGWRPEHGRAAPSRNLDTSYYQWCPRYSDEVRSCSA